MGRYTLTEPPNNMSPEGVRTIFTASTYDQWVMRLVTEDCMRRIREQLMEIIGSGYNPSIGKNRYCIKMDKEKYFSHVGHKDFPCTIPIGLKIGEEREVFPNSKDIEFMKSHKSIILDLIGDTNRNRRICETLSYMNVLSVKEREKLGYGN